MTTTYGIGEFKARLSEILRALEEGEEIVITRRGKPCAKLTLPAPTEANGAAPGEKPFPKLQPGQSPEGILRGYLPDLEWEDFKLAEGPRLPVDLPPVEPKTIPKLPPGASGRGSLRGILGNPTDADFDWARGRKSPRPPRDADAE